MTGSLAPTGDRVTRLALSLLVEPGDPDLARDVEVADPEAVLASWRRRGDPEAARSAARVLLAAAPETGQRWICPGEPEWPPGLADLAEVGELQQRGGAPLGLWVRGPGSLAAVVHRSVAIVGSRASTTYGSQTAGDLAAEAAELGICIVSGAAYGIDAAAHRGALAVGGVTVAVLACGVDVAYPRGNASLLRRVGQRGMLVSELPPGANPTRLRFLSRNRLIAALTSGTVVVEAAWRSGSLNTANWAGSLGRVVMGVPGPVSSLTSQGVHRQIRDGAAQLVTSGAEVAESIAAFGSDTCGWHEGESRPLDSLPDTDRAVFEALMVERELGAGEVAAAARVGDAAAEAALDRLQGRGLAACTERGWLVAPGVVASLRR